ncbi:MAG TPA: hypothetical protein PLL76_04095 [Thermoanaerobaculia bacterium]|nr:hypothetical protein [Thermoanaerobaculia bacterium]
MSAPPLSPIASPPQPGRPEAGRGRSVLRAALALATAGVLTILLVPPGLASVCPADSPCCQGADRPAPGCPGCLPSTEGHGQGEDPGSSLARVGGCGCTVGPAPPLRAALVATAGGVERASAGPPAAASPFVASGTPDGNARRGTRLPVSPGKGGPLHLRNCVLRN